MDWRDALTLGAKGGAEKGGGEKGGGEKGGGEKGDGEKGGEEKGGEIGDRWMSRVWDCIYVRPEPGPQPLEPPPHFWLFGLESSLPRLLRLMELVGKHNGAIFGGFIRDFFRPLSLMHMASRCLYHPLAGSCDVWNIISDFIVPEASLQFVDLDVWFSSRNDYMAFLGDLRKVAEGLTPMQHRVMDRITERNVGATRIQSDPYPMEVDSWSVPFFRIPGPNSAGDDDFFASERQKVLCEHRLKVDCVVSPHLPVNNFAVNLLYFKPANEGCWAVGKPFTLSPYTPGGAMNNPRLQVSEEDVLSHVDFLTTTLLPDYAVFIADTLQTFKHRPMGDLHKEVVKHHPLPSPQHFGFYRNHQHQDDAWGPIIEAKVTRLVERRGFTILHPPPPFRYLPPAKRKRADIHEDPRLAKE